MSDPQTITQLLHRCRDGEPESFDELVPVVYEDLRRIARGQLARWRPGQTLNTTALVHESYGKLARSAELDWTDRGHFFAVAARAMRSVIVDYARSLFANKRSGIKVSIDLVDLPDDGPARAEQILAVDQLLGQLERLDGDMARIVECRFFAGYTLEETGDYLGISRRTVQRKWQRARAWLAALGRDASQR